ncbi:MAG TPA: beta-1-3, beta-1-6-glucan biosynthesis protein [Xanthobacteraceae bacterium]|nr:beta-1-3, beta-1-6-glucan biosynthesis protein [Xanthobacteraceae bacterium]
MSMRVSNVAGSFCVALCLVASSINLSTHSALAQSTEAKPAEPPAQPPAANAKPAKEPQKIDEFAEAQKALTGPAGNPECVWLGRQVVGLLWNNDLDTAFRHLDMYDRFGCPSGHIQIAFRCLVLHPVDPKEKGGDGLNDRVHACWINPSFQTAPAATPAAAVPSQTTTQ